jgi:hypothetical protein
MAAPAGWRSLPRRLRRTIATGFASLVPLSGAPWPDLPAQGWSIDHQGRPVPRAAPMDCGHPVGEPLTGAEERAWVALRSQL